MPELRLLLPKVILASRSPARRLLLEQEGIEVSVRPTDCDETCSEPDPDRAVAMLARRKLDAFEQAYPHCTGDVLCCDTLISFEGELIGKAADRNQAFAQLSRFGGNAQTVHSGFALRYRGSLVCGHDCARVLFRPLGQEEIARYLQTGEWKGAAGSYRIQGKGKDLVARIEGDMSTVIGLPLSRISEILYATVPVCDGAESPPLRG